MSNENQKPELTLSDGALKVSLWKQDGPNGSFYTATFSKTYQNEQGEYQSGHSFAGADLLKLSELAKQSYQQSRELQIKDRQAEKSGKTRDRIRDERER